MEESQTVSGMATQLPRSPRLRDRLVREWRLIAGLGLSALCIVLAVRGISLPVVAEAISAAEWQWVGWALLSVMAGTVFKALRWRSMFSPGSVRLHRTWSVFMIGQMLNALLPWRAGEVGRIYYLGEAENISRAAVLSTVLMEKAADLVMLAVSYLIVAVWLMATPIGVPDWLRQAGTGLLPLMAVALGGLLLFAYAGRRMWHVVQRIFARLPERWRAAIDRVADQAITAFESLRAWRTSIQIWSYSLLIWILAATTNVLIFRAFGLPASPSIALFLVVVLMSGVAVPPLPGNLGVFPYLCVLALGLFGVSREIALAYGITLQVVAYLPLIIVGLGCLLWENWSLRRSPKEARIIQDDVEAE